MVGKGDLPRQRHLAAVDQSHIGDRLMGARHGRVVTTPVHAPVRPATLWRRVVSRASARVIAGRMVVSRRASIDFPTPGGPSSSTLCPQCLHPFSLYLRRCGRIIMTIPATSHDLTTKDAPMSLPLVEKSANRVAIAVGWR
jgi:hypothetical protein